MKKAVLVAPYFLPRRRVGAWRPYKFAIHLRDFGWEPHIITIHDPAGSLTPKEAELLGDISIFEINSPFDFTHKLGGQLEYNGHFSKSNQAGPGISKLLFKPVLEWVDHHFPVDTWMPLLKFRQKKIERYVADVNPHLLWSTGDPWSSHWLASKLAKHFTLPWVADFRDPWTMDEVQIKNRSKFARGIDKKYERSIIEDATMLTFTSRQTMQLYRKKYHTILEQSQTITNSFDATLFNVNEKHALSFNDDYLNLLFFGRFRPLSPAQPFIKVLHHLHRKAPQTAKKIRMYSFGRLTEAEKQQAKEKEVYENFITLKPIALENALPVLSQADILWLSTHPQSKYIIPSKLWDYLAAKRPVLSIAPNPEIAEILQQTGAGQQINLKNETEIAGILCQSVQAKMQNKAIPIPVAFDENRIKQYDACVTTKKLAAIFDRLTTSWQKKAR